MKRFLDGKELQDGRIWPARWDDLRFPVDSVRPLTGQPPTERAFRNGIVYGFSIGDAVTFNVQLPHGYYNGSDLDAHYHFTLPVSGSGAGPENIAFSLSYSWAEIGAQFPVEKTISNEGDVQNAVAENHGYAGIGTIPYADLAQNGGVGVSSMLICRMTRVAASANDYASEVYIMESDIHIQLDAVGSTQEFVK